MRPLDPRTWERLAPLLDEVLEMPPSARADFVEHTLGDEPELRAVLEELIEAEARTGGPLDTSAVRWADSLPGPTRDEPAPVPVVEGYSSLHEVGRGGMGVVYRAIRHGDGFDQEVAMKVVRAGADEPELLRRFERERRILARLEHPHIARLVDGGSTAEGRSFFAMEYVDGLPITRYADDHRLTLAERLRLFEDVCAAVGFAQRQLVVHRDLKPSNVLVDRDGRVRLLDFGIARLIDDDTGEPATDVTHDGARLLTPEYAAPEQLRGEPPSTATDVYALGVVLFELLSGHHPLGDTRAGAVEMAMGLRESQWLPHAVEGERRVLRSDGTIEVTTPTEIAAARRLTAAALRRALSGDLAAIAARALQADPDRRYPTAEAMLADLVRHREGRPIEARSPSWSYRARKTVRRHRTAFAAATLVLIALGVGLGVSLWQARVAAREAARAERAYEFLAGLFQDAHPDAAQGTDWTASQLLERGARRLADAWPDDHAARADLQDAIAGILIDRGDYDTAARMLREALDRDDTAAATDLRLALARAEMRRGRLAVADSLLDTLARSGRSLAPAERSRFLESAAAVRYRQGAFAQAESLMLRVMQITRDEHGEGSAAYASDLNNLGTYLAAQARYDEAESTYTQAASLFEGLDPTPLTELALVRHNLGDLYQSMQRGGEAIEAFREAVALRRRLHPDGHDRLADSLRGLAINHSRRGDLDVADSLLSESAAMTEASLGRETDSYARLLNELAVLAYRRDDLDTARERFVDATAIFEATLGPTHPITMTTTNNLATVQLTTGRHVEAEQTFRRVLERRREALGDDHPDVAFSYNSIGQALRRQGRPDEAITAHEEALVRYVRIHGEKHPTVAEVRTHLGTALRDADRPEEAITQIEIALAYRETTLPPDHRSVADTRLALPEEGVGGERWSDALAALRTAEGEIERTLGPDSSWLANARAARGLCEARLGRVDEGRDLLRDAHQRLLAEFGPDDTRTTRARRFLTEIDG